MPDLPPPGGAPETLVQEFSDFTGGLNLISDSFKLLPNESPNMVNVDISERGGISRRRGWTEQIETNQARGRWGEASDATERHMIFLADGSTNPNTLWYWDGGGSATQLTLATVVQAGVVATDTDWTETEIDWALFEGLAFGARHNRSAGGRATITYDPSGVNAGTANSVAALTDPSPASWDDDYDTPSGTKFPICRYVASHNSSMWAGYVEENGTDYPNRVRWSHPGDGRSWRENDYIDVGDPDDSGDFITAIIPFRDHLVVFKQKSVFAIFGYSPDTFQVIKVADTVGCVARGAVEAHEQGVFFYDETEGVYVWDGQSVTWLFQKVEPAIRNGSILNPDQVRLGFLDHRLWVAVRWNSAGFADAGRVLVWNPIVGEWVMYAGFKLDADDAVNNHVRNVFMFDDGSGAKPYAELAYDDSGTDVSSIVQVDLDGVYTDTVGSGLSYTTQVIYRTPWIDIGDPARDKRWRRPQFILSGGYAQTTTVQIYKDWNSSAVASTLMLTTEAAAGVTNWGAANWGAFSWSEVADLYDVVIRGGAVGSAGRSLSFKFIAPNDSNVWELNAFMITYRNKRLKG